MSDSKAGTPAASAKNSETYSRNRPAPESSRSDPSAPAPPDTRCTPPAYTAFSLAPDPADLARTRLARRYTAWPRAATQFRLRRTTFASSLSCLLDQIRCRCTAIRRQSSSTLRLFTPFNALVTQVALVAEFRNA